MNCLVFGKLKASNVLSIGPEVEYDFRNGEGLTYIYGINNDNDGTANGCGKSNIFINCLLLAIYGKTINNVNNAYVYNRQAPWNEGGYIELEINKNVVENYKIVVELKTCKKRDKCALKFTLYKDGRDITCSTKNETLDYIEKEIIGCSYDIFKNTVIISSSNLINFFEMPMAVKNKYLQGIFSLDSIGSVYDYVNDKLTDVKKNIKSFSDKLFYINKTLDEVTIQNEDWIQLHNTKLNDLTKKLEIEEQKLESDNITNNIVEKPKAYEKKLKAIEKYNDYKDKKQELLMQQKELNKKLITAQAEIKTSKILIEKNQDLLNTICDKCKSKVTKLFALDKAQETIKENTELLNSIKTEEEAIKLSLDKLTKFLEQITEAKLEIKDYNNKVKILKQEQEYIKTNIDSYKKSIDKLKLEENPFSKLLTDNSNAKQEATKSLNKATKIQQYFGILKQIFSDDGVKKYIIGDIIEALNAHIRNYLIKMGADFLVYFDTNLYYEFLTKTGPCEYFSFSAGERRKLDLSVLFAFRDIMSINSVQTNILVVDEILDSAIDAKSLTSVIQILNNKSKMNKQAVYIISHRETLKEQEDLFTHRIRVERTNGITTIMQEF